MTRDELVYFLLLVASIPLGFLFKYGLRGAKCKAAGASLVGFALVAFLCRFDTLHSLVIIAVNAVIIRTSPVRFMPYLSFVWCFGYLLFFRLAHLCGLPAPIAFANAVQLILTLKSVGLAFEIFDSRKRHLKIKMLREKVSGENVLEIDLTALEEIEMEHRYRSVPITLSLLDIFQYSYVYVGIFTGPYFKYRTYSDWLQFDEPKRVRSFAAILHRAKPMPFNALVFVLLTQFISAKDALEDEFYATTSVWYRILWMSLVFTIFRLRFYIAWELAEMSCMAAVLGAYPVGSKSKPGAGPTHLQELKRIDNLAAPSEHHEHHHREHFDFNTVHNIDEYKCETSTSVKNVMLFWNMGVQYWMANNIYRRIPYKVIGQPITMAVSAFWHGIHVGYYLSMLTTTPCIWAEGLMGAGLRRRLHDERLLNLYDFCGWFLRCRLFDYMSIGFILLEFDTTMRFWRSIDFCGHYVCLFFIVLGALLRMIPRAKPKQPQHSE